jgi:cell division cycle 20-like protein 1 (cofactor of APC complex)
MLTDIRTGLPYSKFYGHRQEVCGLKFSFDDAYLASGGNDNAVILWSPKMGKQIVKFDKHCAAVKGLAWNVQELKLIDSIDTGSQVCNMVFS